MLAEANKKGIYKDLAQVDMYNVDISIYSPKFDAFTSIGTFTAGQLKTEIIKIPKIREIRFFSFRDITRENPRIRAS